MSSLFAKSPELSRPGPDVAVIVPTLNERPNIEELLRRLTAALGGIRWEVVFVDDDSPDGTADLARALAQLDHRVRVIQRIGRRGLASASIEGMLASSAPYLAVMDADMQHDERLLPEMLAALEYGDLDVVVGSRYVDRGSLGGASDDRRRISRVATYLAGLMLSTDLKDPLSGFFVIRRGMLEEVVRRLSGIGFKILLDILASAPRPLRLRELPYTFRPRHAGESKLDSLVAWEYLMMLLDKKIGRYVPVRFVHFALVGATGVGVHMFVLWTLFRLIGVDFGLGQALATLTAMTTNFLLNNVFTYRDQRLRKGQLLRGWLSFVAACSVGAVSNVGIASYLYVGTHAGWIWSALAGTIVGAVWNYAVTSMYTWGSSRASGAAPVTRPTGRG
jgi:dolichol-phosphate mannosyltransferase